MKKKILFITPPYHCGVVEVAGHWVPLTFVYLAGAVREAGFEPVIYRNGQCAKCNTRF